MNQHWNTPKHGVTTGIVPTQLKLMNDTPMSQEQYAGVVHAYKLFTDAVRVTLCRFLVQDRILPDGTRVRMVSNSGHDAVLVWPVGGGGDDPLVWSFIIALKKRVADGSQISAADVSTWENIAIQRYRSDAPCFEKENPETTFLAVAVKGKTLLSSKSIKDGSVRIMRIPKFTAGYPTHLSRIRRRSKLTPKYSWGLQQLIVNNKPISTPHTGGLPTAPPGRLDLWQVFVLRGMVFLLVTQENPDGKSGTCKLFARKFSFDVVTNAEFSFALIGSEAYVGPRPGVTLQPFGYDVEVKTDRITDVVTLKTKSKLPTDAAVSSLELTIPPEGEPEAKIALVVAPMEPLDPGSTTVSGGSSTNYEVVGTAVRVREGTEEYHIAAQRVDTYSISTTSTGGTRSRYDQWNRVIESFPGVSSVSTETIDSRSGTAWYSSVAGFGDIELYSSSSGQTAEMNLLFPVPQGTPTYSTTKTLAGSGPLIGDNSSFQLGGPNSWPIYGTSRSRVYYTTITDFKAALALDCAWTEVNGYGPLTGEIQVLLRGNIEAGRTKKVTIYPDVHTHTTELTDWTAAGLSDPTPPGPVSDPLTFVDIPANQARIFGIELGDGKRYNYFADPRYYRGFEAWSSPFFRSASYNAVNNYIYPASNGHLYDQVVVSAGSAPYDTVATTYPHPPNAFFDDGTTLYYNEVNNTFLTQLSLTSKSAPYGESTWYTSNRIFIGNELGATAFEPLINDWLDGLKVKYEDESGREIFPPDAGLRFQPNELFLDSSELPSNSVF